jgi:hypothetical protein
LRSASDFRTPRSVAFKECSRRVALAAFATSPSEQAQSGLTKSQAQRCRIDERGRSRRGSCAFPRTIPPIPPVWKVWGERISVRNFSLKVGTKKSVWRERRGSNLVSKICATD